MKNQFKLLFLTLLAAMLLPIAAQSQTKVSLVNNQANFGKGTQRLDLLDGDLKKGKYFLDKTPNFQIDLPTSLLPADATSMQVIIGGDTTRLSSIAPIMVQGLEAGERGIQVELLNAQGKEVKLKNGAKTKVNLKLISKTPYFKNDAIVLGILICILGLIFWTDSLPQFKGFYRFVPTLLLCYFIPSILNSLGLISGAYSDLYYVASRFLLPASLIFLCLSIDFQGIKNLGPKALIMFFSATLGIVIGGPIALLFVSYVAPGLIGNVTPDELWRGLSTIAGSWIGGGANQTAMKEIYEVNDSIFAPMIVVDVLVANIWMGFLLYGAGISDKLDKLLKADNSAIEDLKKRVADYSASISRTPTTLDMFKIVAFGFAGVALAHWGADVIAPIFKNYNASTIVQIGVDSAGNPEMSNGNIIDWGLSSLMSGFFWLILIATTVGLIYSFTKARELEGVGASRWGTLFIYVLVATIGMKMDLGEVAKNLGLFAVGFVWMLVHVTILLFVAWLIKAPFFFVAVGSQANVGGAASAPIVASAFSPSLAPVGVLMAVLGYALGTYGALICAELMRIAAGG